MYTVELFKFYKAFFYMVIKNLKKTVGVKYSFSFFLTTIYLSRTNQNTNVGRFQKEEKPLKKFLHTNTKTTAIDNL